MSSETLVIIFNVMIGFFVFLFGVTIGSFLNVCIYRLPKGESLVKSNSHCMTCGAQIKWYDLIPILSWLILRGKCRSCGSKISARYILVESLTGIMFVLCYIFYPYSAWGIYFAMLALFLSGLTVLAFQDYDNQEMCVSVIIYTFIIAVATHVINFLDKGLLKMPASINDCIIGAFSVSAVLLIVGFVITPAAYVLFVSQDHKDRRRLKKALKAETNEGKRRQITVKLERAEANIKETGPVFGFGMGDILVVAVEGLMMGWKCVVCSFVIAIVSAAVYAVYKSAVRDDNEKQFAFGPFLIAGFAVSAYFGEFLTNAYLNYLML